ncbi:transporter associated domain-containing protein [Zestomonas thermotolerans]|uniref:transporter associated domain-containing protein n=1 Tax=Zestomonas thermotolerans TaxID=157784 RepID=UPI0003696881|nr:transporter associated domain-containing protein [Pseudomonas thermotolerans]MBO2511450.1 ion transporter [Gammaproteobacteria bacterium]
MNGFAGGLLLGLALALLVALGAWLIRRALRPAPNAADTREQPPLSPLQALQQISIKSIMVPRNEIQGIDIGAEPARILEQLRNATHTRLPLYRDDINQIEGFLHARQIAQLLGRADLDGEALLAAGQAPYFVPEGTPLLTQLLNFQKEKRRIAVVVDEYGEVLGLVSLEDIFRELIGEFSNLDELSPNPAIQPEGDGRYSLDGSLHLRELNRALGWQLPCDGPQTLNGLITEALEQIPENDVCLKVGPYCLETLEISENRVVRVRAWRSQSRAR